MSGNDKDLPAPLDLSLSESQDAVALALILGESFLDNLCLLYFLSFFPFYILKNPLR